MSHISPRAIALLLAVPLFLVMPTDASAQTASDGLLSVTTSPAVPARIIVDDVPRSDWGVGPLPISSGEHEVCFSDVPGFVAPDCATVSVADGETVALQGEFEALGLLKIGIEPVGLPATVFVDGTPRDAFGSYAYSEPGTHEVCWGDVEGHQAPDCTEVDVTAGEETAVTGTFTATSAPTPGDAPDLGATGFLRVTTDPALPSRIVVDDVARGDFGIGPVEFPVGTHTVCFEDVPGFATPPCRDVTVDEGAVAATAGEFDQLGLVQVGVEPAGLPSDIVIDGIPRNRYGLFTYIESGTYEICSSAVAGFDAPDCSSTTVDAGEHAMVTMEHTEAEPEPEPEPEDPPPGSSVFLETFDVDPSSPTIFESDRWDIRRNITDYKMWGVGQSMDAQHGPDCAGPPATHRIDDWMTEGVFMCKNHLMTAANADSYGIITMTPATQIDLSTAGTVSFDLSTLVMSGRDWVDVWITPAEDLLALACGGKCPSYNGAPRNTIHAQKDGRRWVISVIRDFEDVGQAEFYEVGEPSPTIRTPFELSVTPSGVRFGTPEDGRFVEVDAAPGFTTGIVQWAQHTYNPFKDNSGVAATWHWDNFRIEPAVPMGMIKSTTERLIGRPGDVMTAEFDDPAPAGAQVMFNAVCKVELDFGSGFTPISEIPGSNPRGPETSHSYFAPVPEGADSVDVRFAGDRWYTGFPCLFEDPVILVP